jgi:hypothetical protein
MKGNNWNGQVKLGTPQYPGKRRIHDLGTPLSCNSAYVQACRAGHITVSHKVAEACGLLLDMVDVGQARAR